MKGRPNPLSRSAGRPPPRRHWSASSFENPVVPWSCFLGQAPCTCACHRQAQPRHSAHRPALDSVDDRFEAARYLEAPMASFFHENSLSTPGPHLRVRLAPTAPPYGPRRPSGHCSGFGRPPSPAAGLVGSILCSHCPGPRNPRMSLMPSGPRARITWPALLTSRRAGSPTSLARRRGPRPRRRWPGALAPGPWRTSAAPARGCGRAAGRCRAGSQCTSGLRRAPRASEVGHIETCKPTCSAMDAAVNGGPTGTGPSPRMPYSTPLTWTAMPAFDPQEMVARFTGAGRGGPSATRSMPLIEGPERQRFREQAQRDFADYAMIGERARGGAGRRDLDAAHRPAASGCGGGRRRGPGRARRPGGRGPVRQPSAAVVHAGVLHAQHL